MKVFNEIFHRLLVENNVSISDLSRAIGMPYQVINDYGRKDFCPTIVSADKIATYFNCSVDYLFGLSEVKRSCNLYKSADVSVFFERYLNLLKEFKTSHYFLTKTQGLNNSSITKWKNGSIPKTQSLMIIAKYFSVSMDYLIGRTDIK